MSKLHFRFFNYPHKLNTVAKNITGKLSIKEQNI